MARVTGLGGVFLKAKNKAALTAGYQQHLGMDVQHWGGAQFFWKDEEKVDESEFGKFGWVTDPEGTRLELWEPPKA